jgi:hypothetical protein
MMGRELCVEMLEVYFYIVWDGRRGGGCSVGSVPNRGNADIGKDSVLSGTALWQAMQNVVYISLRTGLRVSGQLLLSWIPWLNRRYIWYFSSVFKCSPFSWIFTTSIISLIFPYACLVSRTCCTKPDLYFNVPCIIWRTIRRHCSKVSYVTTYNLKMEQ